jgi:hypothetical protein
VVKVDPKILEAYVGEYRLTPKLTLTISREGDKFWGQVTGQSRVGLLAASETTFFFEGSETGITFVRDANGNVTHLVVHQGIDLEAKKIR